VNSKGQFSLDLIIAVVIFIVFASAIITIVQGFEKSQGNIAIQNQERAIGETVAAKLSQIPMLDKGISDLNFEIPYLLVAGKPGQECNITKSADLITVAYGSGASAISVSVPFKIANTVSFSSLACGSLVNCKNNGTANWGCS
jgi:hypothetical protein